MLEFEARVCEQGGSLCIFLPNARRRGLRKGDVVRAAIVSLTQAERERLMQSATQVLGMIVDEWHAGEYRELEEPMPPPQNAGK